MPQLRHIIAGSAGPAGVLVRFIVQAGPGLLGLLALAYGAWLAWPPAGFMVFGIVVLADVITSRWPARPSEVAGTSERPARMRAVA